MAGQVNIRRLMAALFFVAFLAAQIIVPATKLAETRPARFGWQMYAGYQPLPRYSVRLTNGALWAVDLSQHVGHPRSDLVIRDELVPHLCATIPDVAAVRWSLPGEEEVEIACR